MKQSSSFDDSSITVTSFSIYMHSYLYLGNQTSDQPMPDSYDPCLSILGKLLPSSSYRRQGKDQKQRIPLPCLHVAASGACLQSSASMKCRCEVHPIQPELPSKYLNLPNYLTNKLPNKQRTRLTPHHLHPRSLMCSALWPSKRSLKA